MLRSDAAGSAMAAPAVGTSTTSMRASIAFPGSAGLRPGTSEPDLRKRQNLRTKCHDRVPPGSPRGSQESSPGRTTAVYRISSTTNPSTGQL